jgi:biopolymer transport protein ExbB/TolQ
MKSSSLNQQRAAWLGSTTRMLILLGVSTVLTVVMYVGLWLLVPREAYLSKFFFERSYIQHANTWVFWCVLVALAIKYYDYLLEAKAHRRAAELLKEGFGAALYWSHAPDVLARFDQPDDAAYQGSVIFKRIRGALERLHATQSTAAMESYFRMQSELDAAELETSYAGVKYGVWLLPTLGFVGTVWGIGLGIFQFSQAIDRAQDFEAIRTALPLVTQQLGTAFDTTLLALVYAAIVVFCMSHLLRLQEQVLEDDDRLCSDGVGSLFQEHSTASETIIQAIHENVEAISRRMNGNRGAIETLIRNEVPALVANGVAAPVQSMEKSMSELLQQLNDLLAAAVREQALLQQRFSEEITSLRESQGRLSHELGDVRRVVNRFDARQPPQST